MKSLTQAAINYHKRLEDTPQEDITEERFDLFYAAKQHISGSHITSTYSDGSFGKKEVFWYPDEQRFVDWGNNFWLYGPDSYRGQEKGGTWILSARLSDGPIVEAILDKANSHLSCPSRLHMCRPQMMWRFYWQLLLMDTLRYSGDAIVDLHLIPLDIHSLAPKPQVFVPRERDYISVSA